LKKKTFIAEKIKRCIKNELLKWISGFKSSPRKLFVVHGEEQAMFEFAKLVKEKCGWDVTYPGYKDKVTLN